MYNIKELPIDKQPRERLIELGPDSLNLSELLAIILGTGYKGENVLELAQRLLKDYGEKAITRYHSIDRIMDDFSIPRVKACQIAACFEIGRRVFEEDKGRLPTIASAENVWDHVSDMRTIKKEHLRGLYLNSRYKVIHDEVISIGTLDRSIAHPRDILSPALEYTAAAFVLVHNHPSGELHPSTDDLTITQRLKSASDILGLEFLDHVIVTREAFLSII